jgi:hypothetical protein
MSSRLSECATTDRRIADARLLPLLAGLGVHRIAPLARPMLPPPLPVGAASSDDSLAARQRKTASASSTMSARRRCSSTPAISARSETHRSLRVLDEASIAFPALFGPEVFITLNVSIADAKAELLVTQVVRKSAVASTIMLYHDVNRLKQPLQNISESFSSYTP